MHGELSLGGPLWLFATGLVLLAVVLSGFVFADSMRPSRSTAVAGRLREPLWVYTLLAGLYLALLVIVQVARGVQFAAAIVVLATPLALALGVTYLLRVVFPKAET
jgi:formate-dependent nitrite reductase membrane component NrfD